MPCKCLEKITTIYKLSFFFSLHNWLCTLSQSHTSETHRKFTNWPISICWRSDKRTSNFYNFLFWPVDLGAHGLLGLKLRVAHILAEWARQHDNNLFKWLLITIVLVFRINNCLKTAWAVKDTKPSLVNGRKWAIFFPSMLPNQTVSLNESSFLYGTPCLWPVQTLKLCAVCHCLCLDLFVFGRPLSNSDFEWPWWQQ